jgi:hypothetical protein
MSPAFGKGRAVFFDTASDRVLGYIRNKQLLVLANFSDAPATILPSVLRAYIQLPVQLVDLVSGETFSTDEGISLGAYQFAWLVR